MTDKEIKIWNELHVAERVGIILSFNLMLVKHRLYITFTHTNSFYDK